MKEATSIKRPSSHPYLFIYGGVCVCVTCARVHGDEWCNGAGVYHIRGCEVLVGKYEWGSVKSVGAYHERERLCPEGMEVWEVARVHYECKVI